MSVSSSRFLQAGRGLVASRAFRQFSSRGVALNKLQLDDLLVDAKNVGGEGYDTMTKETRPGAYLSKISRKGDPLPGDIEPPELLDPTYRTKAGLLSTFSDWLASEVVRWTGKDSSGFTTQETMKKFGAYKEKEVTFKYRSIGLDAAAMEKQRAKLKKIAEEKMAAITKNGKPEIHVFMTGAAGFIGQDLIQRLSTDDSIKSLSGVILKEELGGLPLDKWTTLFLDRLDIPRNLHSKFEFVIGDCEKPLLGLTQEYIDKLKPKCTHFAHLAASVSFEDPYNFMYGKNVLATQYAIEVAQQLQDAPGSPFVNGVFTETCYIHGRRRPHLSKESELVFPNDYYSNYYELTKALGDIIAMEACYQRDLRVIACCPAIVIGNKVNGNNHGDRKVINAAVNAFGRIYDELGKLPQPAKWIAYRNVLAFPGNATFTMNLSPVDRIVDGLEGALKNPKATGERVHLGSGGINSGMITQLFQEEIGINVRYVNPVIHRIVRRKILKVMFNSLGMSKLYSRLEVLFNIFAGYAEWGQPNHELGNDVRLLGMDPKRPNLEHVVRLMCRHNGYVQNWGQIRDRDEIARREKIWKVFVADLEKKEGKKFGDIHPAVFKKAAAEKKLF